MKNKFPSPPDKSHPSETCSRRWLELSDEALLHECQVDKYRASGPGGQKRNKTSSAVRLRHLPTGTIVTATESRSQHENRARALRRLREAIALGQRNTVDPAAEPPPFLADALRRNPGLRVSSRHDDYCLILQYVLDVLVATGGCVARTGASIGLSTSQLVRFLQNDPKLWAQTNRIRQGFNLKTLS